MGNVWREFSFDYKVIGMSYAIPFVSYVLCIMIILSDSSSSDPYFGYAFLQGMAIPLAGVHTVFLYKYVLEDGAFETLVPLHRKRIYVDVMRYTLLHGGIVFALLMLLVYVNGSQFFTIEKTVHIVALFIFYQLIGLALLTFIRNFEISVAVVGMYTFIEVVTRGEFMPWPRIFIFYDPFLYDMQWKFFFIGLGIVLSLIQIIRTFSLR
ncbi:hypothetical protein ACE1TF_04070 [Geomicrobium sp. JSM 1781026]|uniref:hypothetical protein n=1 Tax=Geomicrobium sp. JSM 1781026 TaxID=3344580 RepID=UPI0035BED449